MMRGWIGRICLTVALVGTASMAQAQVVFDACTESHTGGTGSASEASFTWNHDPVGAPRGLIIWTMVLTNSTDLAGTVTYDGTTIPPLTGGAAVDINGEALHLKAYFLGSNVPATDPAAVVINRTNNADVMYAVACTVTAGGDTETNGIVLLQEDQSLAEQSVDDGSPGTNSVRFAGIASGIGNAPPTVGAASTLGQEIDIGGQTASVVRETTAGQGARSVGWTEAAPDDVAAVHLAIRQVAAAGGVIKQLLLMGVGPQW